MTDRDDTEDVEGGRQKPPSRADSIRLPAIPPRPRKWPVGPADDYPTFGAKGSETGETRETGKTGETREARETGKTGEARETGETGKPGETEKTGETRGTGGPREINAGPLLASTTQAQTFGGPPTRRRRLTIGLVVAVVAALAAVVVVWQWPSDGDSPAGGVRQAAAAADAAPVPGAPHPSKDGSTDGAAAPTGETTTGTSASPGVSHPAGASEPTSAAAGTTTPKATEGTTPAPSGKTNASGVNLARGGVASASSVEDPRWKASMAIDGDETDSRWSSAYSDPQWWKVDLKQAYQLTTVTLFWERAHAVAYRVETSTDGATWKTIYSTGAGQGGTVPVRATGTVARYVRVSGTQRFNEYGYSLYEVEVR